MFVCERCNIDGLWGIMHGVSDQFSLYQWIIFQHILIWSTEIKPGGTRSRPPHTIHKDP